MSMTFAVFTITALALVLATAVVNGFTFTGINLSGGEFGSEPSGSQPFFGTEPANYLFPYQSSISYWASKGVTVVRLPFFWERLQESVDADLDATYLGYIQSAVENLTADNINVILDAHLVEGCSYMGTYLSNSTTPTYADFGNFWGQVATLFKDNPNVWFGLLNEPYGVQASDWLQAANTAIASIRATGATNKILVCGSGYTGVHDWTVDDLGYGTNSVTMTGIIDSANNYFIEVHQYFDSDFAGKASDCDGSLNITTIFEPFTSWARAGNYKAFLGEFGAPNTSTCQTLITAALNYMQENDDVFVGWTWWVAGTAWSYYSGLGTAGLYSIEPSLGTTTNKPQLAWISPFFAPRALGESESESGAGFRVRVPATAFWNTFY